ncbi:MAG TPA: alpha-E domain-containing protein [Tepidisphaeraceae bacterium]|jgi:uncharacterized alpha-E superfamily protein|nr:alpha-E domain-containing protein [Tepidisphaeraceae bacterium]
MSTPETTKLFEFSSRPMLSRDADSMYWIARYIERAEHVARILLVNSNLLMDVGDLAPALQQRQWRSILEIMRLDELPPSREPLARRIQHYMTFNTENPSSLINCLSRARENARAIRESISAEMWECLNTLYWSIQADDARQRFEDASEEFYRSIMTGSMVFQGMTDQTLTHDQRWNFAQLAKYLERTDITARIIETKFGILKSAELEVAIRNIHWMAVLRSCCSIEAFRRNYVGDMDPLRVASFLILQRSFPRSIRYCVEQAHAAISSIRSVSNLKGVDPAERILGRLSAQLEYAEINEIISTGVSAYLQQIQSSIAEAAVAVQKSYFLY